MLMNIFLRISFRRKTSKASKIGKKTFQPFIFLSATFNPEERKPKKFPAFRIKTERQKKKESENNSDFLKREECLQLC